MHAHRGGGPSGDRGRPGPVCRDPRFGCCRRFPVGSSLSGDYWERRGDAWIRHHRVPRKLPFVPLPGPGAPDPAVLDSCRHTTLRKTDGSVEHLDDDWRRDNDMEPTPYFWVGCTSFRMRSLPAASPRLGPVEEGERFPMSAADAEIVLRALRSVDLPISPREGFGDTGRAWGALIRGALPSWAG
jgi:hypothetical protein